VTRTNAGDITVNNAASVTRPDLIATNGVIHVIDTVLIPPHLAEEHRLRAIALVNHGSVETEMVNYNRAVEYKMEEVGSQEDIEDNSQDIEDNSQDIEDNSQDIEDNSQDIEDNSRDDDGPPSPTDDDSDDAGGNFWAPIEQFFEDVRNMVADVVRNVLGNVGNLFG
jgi:hypothetical protein